MRVFLIGLAAFLVSCMQAPPYYHPDQVPNQPGHQTPSPYPQTPIPGSQPPVGQPGGQICGGLMGARCSGAGEFCYLRPEAQCGAADQTGVCRPLPQVCTQEYAPVCGCDGQTYSNECSANSRGVSAAYRGPCRN